MTLEARAIDTEEQWIERARAGDQLAFEQIYRAYSGKVYGLCLRLTREPSVAEDCTQETFISAWRNLGRFEGRSALGTWLHRIAVNAAPARGRRGHLEVVPAPQHEEGSEPESAVLSGRFAAHRCGGRDRVATGGRAARAGALWNLWLHA